MRNMIPRHHWFPLSGWLLACMVILWPLPGWADGKVFAQRAVVASVQVPDQRAMIHYTNGWERLVIETSFVGEGTKFAWVVPLPSEPVIEAISNDFFPRLDFSFQPRVIHQVDNLWIGFVVVGSILIVGVFIKRSTDRHGFLVFILFIFVVILLLSMMLPALATARGKGFGPSLAPESVHVLNRQAVGIYDTAVLKGPDGQALITWLNDNGFHTPSQALPMIEQYARSNWVFAAMRLNETSNSLHHQPHPLSFAFATDRAVYPMRLTGVDNKVCTVELYVFGPAQAEAPHFTTQFAGLPVWGKSTIGDESDRSFAFMPNPGELRFRNPEVRRWIEPAQAVTKLTARLSPSQMKDDAWITWRTLQPQYPVYYSYKAASVSGWNWFVGLGMLASVVWVFLLPHCRMFSSKEVLFACWFLAFLVAGSMWAGMHPVQVRVLNHGGWRSLHQYKMIQGETRMLEEDWMATSTTERRNAPMTPARLWGAINQTQTPLVNAFTGKPLRLEASPGNLTLQTNSNGLEVRWHDIDAIPQVLGTFPMDQ